MTVDPIAAYEVPDVEAALWAELGGWGGLRLWTYDVQEDALGWVTAHAVQVDARGPNKKDAHDLAWAVRSHMLTLRGATLGTGWCVDVTVVTGPNWLPDENGAPRYVARYSIRVRPGADAEGAAS